MAQKEWHEENHYANGYRWSVRAEIGIVEILEEDLFSRIEFNHLSKHSSKVGYAMNLGWRHNVDSGKWYRIRGH